MVDRAGPTYFHFVIFEPHPPRSGLLQQESILAPGPAAFILSGEWSMKLIHAGLLFVAIFCQYGDRCHAQQGSLGPTDVDGFYEPPAEAVPPAPKQRASHKRAKTETARDSASESKLTNWEEESARQQADDDRLRSKLNICQNCMSPNDKGKSAGARAN